MSNELTEHLAASSPVPDDPSVPFEIENDEQALWAVQKLRSRTDRIAEIRALADAEIARIEEWVEKTSKRPLADAQFFIGHLERYALDERSNSFEERKTVSLPGATISTRYNAPRAQIAEPETFVAWAVDNKRDELLTVKPAVAKVAKAFQVGEFVTDFHGEIVPGVIAIPGSITATVKLEALRNEDEVYGDE